MVGLTRAMWITPCCAAIVCCTLVLNPAETQCSSDADCAGRGLAFANARCIANTCQSIPAESGPPLDAGPDVVDTSDPTWCLGNTGYIQPDPTRRVTLRQQFVRQGDQTPIHAGEATIKLCAHSDLSCVSPRATLEPDDTGFVSFDVEYGFSGYFDFTSPGLQNSIMEVNPLVDESAQRPALQALNPVTAQLLASTLLGSDVKLEPELAHTILAIVDCNGNRFAGVSYQAAIVDVKNRTHVFYILNPGLPTPGGTETNEQGQAGFINLPPGVGTITGTYNVRQQKVVRLDVVLRAGYFTYGLLRPQDFQ